MHGHLGKWDEEHSKGMIPTEGRSVLSQPEQRARRCSVGHSLHCTCILYVLLDARYFTI